MRDISPSLSSHIIGGVTSISMLIKITRLDGVIFGYTDSVKDITSEGQLYKAGTGFTVSAMSQSAKFNVEHLEAEGFTPLAGVDDDDITDSDLLSGKFDDATVEVFQVNYERVDDGNIKILKGTIGQFTLKNNQFSTEVFSLGSAFQHKIGDLYSLSCRATLGDEKCKVALGDQKQTQSIRLGAALTSGDTISATVDGRDTNRVVIDADLEAGDEIFINVDGQLITQAFTTTNNTTLDFLAIQIQAEPNVLTAIRTDNRTIEVISTDDEISILFTQLQLTGPTPPAIILTAIDGPSWPVSQLFDTDSDNTLVLFAAALQARPRLGVATVTPITGAVDNDREVVVESSIAGESVVIGLLTVSPTATTVTLTEILKASIGLVFTGAVDFSASNQRFTAQMPLNPTGDFDYGILTWNTGENTGISIEVVSFVNAGFGDTGITSPGGLFDLFLPMGSQINLGDSFSVTVGCDKKFSTCKAKFDNVKNFRGEPHIPLPEKAAQTPRSF
jgi:hypothetical protein